jgi:uncharacterized protein (TIGR02147 family)
VRRDSPLASLQHARGNSLAPVFELQVLYQIGRLPYIDRMKTNLLATAVRPDDSTSFRLFLQAELGRRCARNPQYSLRAFAKFLAVDHATLSQLLRGKRALTARSILKLGTRLGLDRPAIDRYATHQASLAEYAEDEAALHEVQQLASDTAAVIADWYHFAILELTRLRDFKTDSRWIARVLGITADEVNIALTRLTRLGLLEMVSRDRWIDRAADLTASLAGFNRAAVQRLAAQVRQLLMRALGSVQPGCCEHSTTALALSTARVPAVLERIARFRRELMTLLEQDPARDDVYQLEINFFPITNLQHDKENNHGATGDAVANPGQGPR